MARPPSKPPFTLIPGLKPDDNGEPFEGNLPGRRQRQPPFKHPPLPPTMKYQPTPGKKFRWLSDEEEIGAEIGFETVEDVLSALPNQVDPVDVIFTPEWLESLRRTRRSVFDFEFTITCMVILKEDLDQEPAFHRFDAEFQYRYPRWRTPRFTRLKHPTEIRAPIVGADGTQFYMYRAPLLQECLEQVWVVLQYIINFIKRQYLSTKGVIWRFFLTRWIADQTIIAPVPRAKKPAKKPAVKPAKPSKKPAKKPAARPEKKPAKKPVAKPAKKPAKKIVEKQKRDPRTGHFLPRPKPVRRDPKTGRYAPAPKPVRKGPAWKRQRRDRLGRFGQLKKK